MNNATTFRIGLTGGIASGKSTVAALFAELGVPVVDTDVVSRDVVQPGSGALSEISAHFGESVLNEDTTLNRAALRGIIFQSPHARAELEAILHPRIRKETLARADAAEGPYQILVVPLLFETSFDALVQRSLVVDCPEDVQRERLSARDQESPETIERIIASQMSREERLAKADDVINNTDSLEALQEQVRLLHKRYLELSALPHER